MAYAGRDYPPFEDQAGRILVVDLANLLASGETITAVTSRLRTLSGTDDLPALHLPVAPQSSGSVVSQLTVFDDPAAALVGNEYALSFAATTSAGQVFGPWARFEIAPGFGVTTYPGGSPTAGAQSIILTAAPLSYILPTLMGGYVGQDFPVANQGEKLAYGFDFAPALSPGETIASASAFLALLEGTDAAVTASPTAHNSGAAAIAGSVVTQLLAWPGGSALVGNVYALNLTAVTSANQSLAANARVTIGRVG